ncbi:MAG TPA: tetratricopeptide repeat protein [bacterium]|nr:tetratricopeptide repeat protein [bacterium]
MKYNRFICVLLCAVMFLLIQMINTAYSQENDVVNEESGKEYRNGRKLFKEGNYSQSIEHFKKAYMLDERNITSLFAHGLALYKLQKFKEASEKFLLVLTKEPNNEKALKMLPLAFTNDGETEKALAAYDSGIEANPGDYYFYQGKARIYIDLQKYEEAIKLLNKAIEIEPQRIELYETIAYVYRDMGMNDEAHKAALKVLEKSKNNARALVIVADYKRLSGKYEEALEDYELAARNIETKAYAEHFIEVINQKLEEIEIEKEYEARQNAK